MSTTRDSNNIPDEDRLSRVKKQLHQHFKHWLSTPKLERITQSIAEDDDEVQPGFIGDYHEAPEFIQDEYIEHGYRIGYPTYCSLCKTLFTWNNETVNVWTHMLGAIAFVVILIILLVNAGKAIMTARAQMQMDQNHVGLAELTKIEVD